MTEILQEGNQGIPHEGGEGIPREGNEGIPHEGDEEEVAETASEQVTRHAQRLDRLFQVASAIMLALVAVGTAWSGYQATRWSGVQAAAYVEASSTRIASAEAATRAGQLTQVDVGLFSNWINAYAAGDEPLTTFYQARFRPEFKPAFEAWVATQPRTNPNAPSSPFAMPEYQLQASKEATQLAAQAEALFEQGQTANQVSDDYVLNTVILAAVLFFLAIAERFEWLAVRIFVLTAALVLLGFAVYRMAAFPIN